MKFVVYKFPSSAYDGYMYMTSETAAQGWTVSNHTIQQPNSMVARSISRMYLKDSKVMLVT
ncbi:unnamed protein product [Nesidiocoris tenuis]|uniref:Uncharacterized protein n=1 Tax=Nesidiocoris tenuis TaxID=355587 RepID=A0A6H5GDK0_9HEMI|nr:unnamed protein product [Nesidiocoris tenuis]